MTGFSNLIGILIRVCFAQYIQCDNCKKWYHCGCVGIVLSDLRLEEDELFICPPCQYVNSLQHTSFWLTRYAPKIFSRSRWYFALLMLRTELIFSLIQPLRVTQCEAMKTNASVLIAASQAMPKTMANSSWRELLVGSQPQKPTPIIFG